MHPTRRSKTKLLKTSFSNLKTVEVGRGRNGYGFTMTGQYPCVLGSILTGSPADIAGLKSGDCVMAVNGENVTRIGHEQIIKLIGSTSGVLRLTVADIQESESSDEDYVPVVRTRYLRSKNTTPTANNNGDEIDLNTLNPGAFSAQQQQSLYGKIDTKTSPSTDSDNKFAPGHLSPYNRSGKASVILQKSSSTYDYTFWNGRGFEHIGIAQKPRRVKRHAENRQFRQRAHSAQSRSSFYAEGEEDEVDQGLRPLTPVEVSNILYPSLHPNMRSKPQHRRSAPTLKERQVFLKAVVGYLGSIDIPASANLPTASLQAIRGCVRRLHLEQRVHSLMLMEITNFGVELINANQKVAVVYPSDRITFSGVCPDDKRCFGIVTIQNQEEGLDCVDSDEEPIGSSCHVFIVDPSLSCHSVHVQLAARFNVQCVHDPATNTCQQFPTSSHPLLTHISQLHRDHGNRLHFADFYGQSLYAAGPRRSNSNSSNSDSGFGNGKENGTESNQGERIMIVDVAGHIRNQRIRGLPEVQGPDNTSPNRHVVHAEINTSHSSCSLSSASPSSPEHSPQSASIHSKLLDPSGRLTPRARPDPVLKDFSGHVTPHARQAVAALNPSSGRLTPRARPDPHSVGSTQALLMPRQGNKHMTSRQYVQTASTMMHPVDHLVNSAGGIPITKNPQPITSDVNLHMQNRQTSSISVKGRPPTGRHSMYAKLDDNHRSQEAENSSRKKQREFKQRMPQIQRYGVPTQLDLARRNSDCSEYSSSNLQTARQRALHVRSRQVHVQLQEPGSRVSLAASDGELDVPEGESSLKSDGNRSNPNLLSLGDGPEIGRVSSWAVSFDRLLQDELGLACFTEFLKREFSEENIMFWIACETMSKMTKKEELKRMSEHIYNKHLSDEASMPVNLDSSCRLKVLQALKSPTPEMFKVQQQQIFQLMKYDSYSRFLKSKVYQDCVLAEMAGNPLPISFTRQRSDGSVSSTEEATGESKKGTPKGNKKKYHIWKTAKSYSLDAGEDSPDKKRKPLLPWNRAKVTRKLSKDADASEETGTYNAVNMKLTSDQPSGSGGHLMDRGLPVASKPALNGHTQMIALEGTCRLVFPNDDVVVLPARRGFTVGDVLSPHLDVRQLNLQSVETFLADSKEIVDFQRDMSDMAGTEIVIEQRVLFKMELPSHRVIGVKSKPTKKLIEVLRPVTHKYNLQLDALVIHLSNSPVPLDLDITVASLDGQKILIETLQQYGAGNYQARARVDPPSSKTAPANSAIHKSASAESFIKKHDSRTTQVVQPQRRFSENGSQGNDTTSGNEMMLAPEVKGHPVVTLRPSNSETSVQRRKSQNRNYKITNSDAEELYKMLSKAQRRRIDDQRGLTIRNLDLPDFLKKPNKETSSHRPKSSLGTPYQYKKPEFVENLEMNEDAGKRFKDMALRCKSTPPAPYTHEMALREGVIPSHSQAEAVFGGGGRCSDITPQTFNESMMAVADEAHGYDEANLDAMQYGHYQAALSSSDKLSPRTYPSDSLFTTASGYPTQGRGYSLDIYDVNPNDDYVGGHSDEKQHDDDCHADPWQEFDLDKTLTKSESGNETFLPPPPDELEHTLHLEEANYSPPPPVVPHTSNQDSPYTEGGNQLKLTLSQPGDAIQGSTLPGHASDMSNLPLTDTDSVDFGDDPLNDDLLSPRPPSPSTHDLIMTPNSEENFNAAAQGHLGPLYSSQQRDLTQTHIENHSSKGPCMRPDVLGSFLEPGNSNTSRLGSAQYDASLQPACESSSSLASASQPVSSLHQFESENSQNTASQSIDSQNIASQYGTSQYSTFHPGTSRHSAPQPGTSWHRISQPSTFKPSASQPGTSQPSAPQPGTSKPGTFQPPTSQPGTFQPNTSQPSTFQPGTFQPGTFQANTFQPNTSQPGTSRPGTFQPPTSQPNTSQPGTFQPSMSQPGTSQPGTSWPSTSQPGTLQLSMSQPGTSWPSTSQPGTSQHSASAGNAVVPKQGINLQWKAARGVQQQRVDHDKWETVVKDGRTMRATFV